MNNNFLNINPSWKVKNTKYLCALQKFFDKASNIENTNLRNDIIYQMLECDKILTELILEESRK